MAWKHGKFFWNELMTRDTEKARKFYAATLGWQFEALTMGEGIYWVAKSGDEAVGGIFEMDGPAFAGVEDHWVGYISVDDIDERFKTAGTHGAGLIRAPFDLPTIGRIAILRDPVGSVIGWVTPEAPKS